MLQDQHEVDVWFAAHYTHPGAMEGAPRLRQHDNVQRQLTSFEKLLKRAISRFSLDKFVAHMRSIQKIMKDSQPEIKSLVQLHNILHGVTQEAKNTVNPIDSNVQLLRYFDAFYDDVDYLRKLKKYFDEKIYTCLYDYFYDPADDPVEPEVVSPHQTPRASGSDSGHVSEEADDEVSDTGMEAFHSLTPKGKLSQAVKDMYKLNQKWERILNTDLIDPRDYDSDSHYEVSKYTDLKWCDLIIRLVPDVFVKAYKSINLARIWWTQANKIYTTLPAKSKATTMYSNRVKNLEDTLCTLHNGIQQNEQQLKQKEHDLQELRDRESRVDVLSQSCERVEGMRLDMGQTYDDLVIQRDELCKSLAHHNLGADEHRKIKLKRDHLDSQLRKVSHELRVLAFHQQVLQEDFHLELTVRPDIIRFIGDVETKHDDIVEDMNEKKWKKRQAEKQLTLMRNNHEKMKEVKSKLLPSREPTIDSEVSNLSEGSTMDLIDNGRGNTFTVESARNKSKPRGTILPALPINEEPSDSSYSSTDIPDTSRTGSDDSGKSSRQPARAGHKIQPSRIPKLRTDQYGKRAEAPRY